MKILWKVLFALTLFGIWASVAAAQPSEADDQTIAAAPAKLTSGTGFYINHHGVVATNAHMVNKCKDLRVIQGEKSKPAVVLALGNGVDLAVIDTGSPSDAGVLRTTSLRLGEMVAVFGFPLSGSLSTDGIFSLGYVSALRGLRNDARTMQLSSPIQPGNSGSPVVDETGAVVGVVSTNLPAIKKANISLQNVNFAIKLEHLRAFLDENKIEYASGKAGRSRMDTADLAEQTKNFTVNVRCQH